MLRTSGATLAWEEFSEIGVVRVLDHPHLAGTDWVHSGTEDAPHPVGVPRPPSGCTVPGCTAVFAMPSALEQHTHTHEQTLQQDLDSCVMLQTLIQCGMLEPGIDALQLVTARQTHRVTLNTDGVLSISTTTGATVFPTVHAFVTG